MPADKTLSPPQAYTFQQKIDTERKKWNDNRFHIDSANNRRHAASLHYAAHVAPDNNKQNECSRACRAVLPRNASDTMAEHLIWPISDHKQSRKHQAVVNDDSSVQPVHHKLSWDVSRQEPFTATTHRFCSHAILDYKRRGIQQSHNEEKMERQELLRLHHANERRLKQLKNDKEACLMNEWPHGLSPGKLLVAKAQGLQVGGVGYAEESGTPKIPFGHPDELESRARRVLSTQCSCEAQRLVTTRAATPCG